MDNVLSKALREFTTGPLNQLIVNLGGQDGDRWKEELNRFLRKEPCWSKGCGMQAAEPKSSISILTIDHRKSLAEMIALGHYDWKNDDITAERFPVKGEGVVEYEARLFHFNRDISSEDAERQIRGEDVEHPWEPAKIEHLLTFGAKHPDEQRRFPIVGLGSVCEFGGSRGVPFLSKGGSERRLDLDWCDDDWGAGYRFLAVRRVVTPS